MSNRYHAEFDLGEAGLVCGKCQVPLENSELVLHYMGNDFPILMPRCPRCGQAFIPEELALGKILQVERALEDK